MPSVGVVDDATDVAGDGAGLGRLVVVRHGQTAWSRAGRHTGRTDLALEPEGEREAAAIGRRLAGHRFAAVWTSPALRARRTCELAGFGHRSEVIDDLAEWDYGAYEGRTTAEIRDERPRWSIWADGVPHGEGLDDLARRADRVVARAKEASGDVLAFAHAHVLRVVAARWVGLPPVAAAGFVLGAGAVSVLGWERDTPAVVRWNDDGGDPLA